MTTSDEIKLRKLWNIHLRPFTIRRGLLSTTARRWVEQTIRDNEAKIAELAALPVFVDFDEPVVDLNEFVEFTS